jgi:ABC-type transport system substrate-binding protein
MIAPQDRAMDTPDPESLFSVVYAGQAGSNYGRYTDPKVDDLADRALRETNRDRRKQIYWELQRHILASPMAAVPVAWVEGWFFMDKKVRGYKPALTTYDNNTLLKVWLAP